MPPTDMRIDLIGHTGGNAMLTSAAADTGQYVWAIPASQPLADDHRIRITSLWDSSYCAFSDWYFSIEPATAVKESRWPLY